ncbi:MAG: hypothetical protein WCC67_02780, partial [Candidatus Acidiferrales bacterium]
MGNNNYLGIAGHCEVARLARFVGNFFHQRARLRDYSLQGMMAVGEFEKFQRELKTLIGQHLRNIAALG